MYSAAVLFSIQMESQKEYYQKQIDDMTLYNSSQIETIENLKLIQKKNETEYLNQLEVEKKKYHVVENKFKEANDKLRILRKEFEEEKILSKGLQAAVTKLTDKLNQQSHVIEELKSELSDLYLHFQAQETLSKTSGLSSNDITNSENKNSKLSLKLSVKNGDEEPSLDELSHAQISIKASTSKKGRKKR